MLDEEITWTLQSTILPNLKCQIRFIINLQLCDCFFSLSFSLYFFCIVLSYPCTIDYGIEWETDKTTNKEQFVGSREEDMKIEFNFTSRPRGMDAH